LRSPESKRGYRHAIDEFIQCYCSEFRLSFKKVVVTRFRIVLEGRGLAAGTINGRLAAVPRHRAVAVPPSGRVADFSSGWPARVMSGPRVRYKRSRMFPAEHGPCRSTLHHPLKRLEQAPRRFQRKSAML
jgi:hypothetical protein